MPFKVLGLYIHTLCLFNLFIYKYQMQSGIQIGETRKIEKCPICYYFLLYLLYKEINIQHKITADGTFFYLPCFSYLDATWHLQEI